jgi:hypothetical protein
MLELALRLILLKHERNKESESVLFQAIPRTSKTFVSTHVLNGKSDRGESPFVLSSWPPPQAAFIKPIYIIL